MSRCDLSRRDFLKLTGYGLMGMLLPDLSSTLPRQDEFDNLQGRITDRVLWSYDAPNAKAKRVKLYWRDIVLPILNTTIGEDDTAYNRVWYETEEGGYVYSGSVEDHATRNIPILFLSGIIMKESGKAEQDIKVGGEFYSALPKPFGEEELLTAVHKLLEN